LNSRTQSGDTTTAAVAVFLRKVANEHGFYKHRHKSINKHMNQKRYLAVCRRGDVRRAYKSGKAKKIRNGDPECCTHLLQHHAQQWNHKKLSCSRETAHRFVL